MNVRACLTLMVLALLISACGYMSNIYSSGLVQTFPVAYPIRGPEYVWRNLGDQRYILAQGYIGPAGYEVQTRYRFYDRKNNVLTRILDSSNGLLAFRRDATLSGTVSVRYSSNNPQLIAFLTNRDFGFDNYCHTEDDAESGYCGSAYILLSMDGGRSFFSRKVLLPSLVAKMKTSTRKLEFADIRNNNLYIGVAELPTAHQQYFDKLFGYFREGGVTIGRYRKNNPVFGNHAITVLSIPLPTENDQIAPFPSHDEYSRENHSDSEWKAYWEQRDKFLRQLSPLRAARLTGARLEDYPLGELDPLVPNKANPSPPRGVGVEHFGSVRRGYVESLRAMYPEWAKQQKLNLPEKLTYETAEERRQRIETIPSLQDDPIEWVRFEDAR